MRYLILTFVFIININVQASDQALEDSDELNGDNSWSFIFGPYAAGASNDSANDSTVLLGMNYEIHHNEYFSFNTKLYTLGQTSPFGLQLSYKARANWGGFARFGVNLSTASGSDSGGFGLVEAFGFEHISDSGFTTAIELELLRGGDVGSIGINLQFGHSF